MTESQRAALAGSDRDVALLLAAVVAHVGGHVVLNPADLHDVGHVHLGIEMNADGTIEITTRLAGEATQ